MQKTSKTRPLKRKPPFHAQPDMDDSQALTSADAEQVFDRMAHHPDYRMYVAIRDDRIVGTFARSS